MNAFPITRAAAIALASIMVNPAPVHAQAWPERPVTLMVGFPEGGPNDILGRLVATAMSQRLGQTFVVVNQPGASGNIATEAVTKAQPDGHTLLLIGPANAITSSQPALWPFDFRKDIVPVAGVTREALVLVVHTDVPARSVAEFVALAKASPGKYTMASTGNGSSPHVSGLLFNRMTGLELPIRHFAGGGPALRGMIGGEAQIMFEPMSASIEPVKSGKLRALAVTTLARAPTLPEVPALADTVPGYEASAVTGIGVPAGTPAALVETMNRQINATLADPKVAAQLAETGGTLLTGSQTDFAALVASEIDKWSLVVKAAGVKLNQ